MHYPHTILDDVVTALEIINHFPKLFCLIYDRLSLFCSLGHSRPGKIQDHHHSLLSRGHGLHFNVWHHQWRILQCCTRLVSYCHYKWRSSSIWKSIPFTAVAMVQWPMYVYHELQFYLCREAKKKLVTFTTTVRWFEKLFWWLFFILFTSGFCINKSSFSRIERLAKM